jgi:hypothetical protein
MDGWSIVKFVGQLGNHSRLLSGSARVRPFRAAPSRYRVAHRENLSPQPMMGRVEVVADMPVELRAALWSRTKGRETTG